MKVVSVILLETKVVFLLLIIRDQENVLGTVCAEYKYYLKERWMTNLLSCVVSLYGAQAQTVSLDGTIGETPRMPMYCQVAVVQTQQVFDDRSRDGGALGGRLKGGRGRGVEHLVPVFAKGQLEAELHTYNIYI